RESVWKQSHAQGYGCESASSNDNVIVGPRARARSGSRLNADRARLRRTETLAQAAADTARALDLQLAVAVELERARHGAVVHALVAGLAAMGQASAGVEAGRAHLDVLVVEQRQQRARRTDLRALEAGAQHAGRL